jgi:hypothetical protein
MTNRIRALSALGLAVIMSSTAAAQTPAPAPAAPAAAPPTATEAPPAAEPAPPVVAPMYVEPPATPATVEPEAEAPAKVGYDKGFFIESGDEQFRIAISSRVQPRYTYVSVDGGPDSSAFSIERARLKLEGHAFTEDLTYAFQTEFGKGVVYLRDYYTDYRIVPEWLHLRTGQWKRPFSRQQINSSGSLEMVDRAITDSAFGAGRDIGIAFHNNYEKSPELEYAFGLFNGTGDRPITSVSAEADAMTGEVTGTASSTNVPRMWHPALVARVGYNHGGLKGYSEVDLEGGDVRFGVGASGQVDFDADQGDDTVAKAELDAILKVQGFSTTGAVYVSSIQSGAGFSDRGLGAIGFHLQAGYLIAELIQPVARIAIVAPEGESNDERELALGFGIFPFGHNVKWQTDFAALTDEGEDEDSTDLRLRSQMQLAF